MQFAYEKRRKKYRNNRDKYGKCEITCYISSCRYTSYYRENLWRNRSFYPWYI